MENIHSVLREKARLNNGFLNFKDFSEISLFDKKFGYYQKNKIRVGKNETTDFYTASQMGDVFGDLVCSAAKTLLEDNLKNWNLIEIGAEPNQNIFKNNASCFKSHKRIFLNDKIEIPNNSIVFSNELFDAQPFYRIVFIQNKWREIGVFEKNDTEWEEIILPEISNPELSDFIKQNLPENFTEGWHLDISLEAEKLMQKICANNWKGAFIFFDYGKTLNDCLECFPEGTARAYSHHQQNNFLTKCPGEQDLTCHIFWDRLTNIAVKNNFHNTSTLRQEAFFMKYSLLEISKIIKDQTNKNAAINKGKLQELLHPAIMGHCFQTISGIRK